MAVPVDHDHVIGRHGVMPHHLVAGAGAVGDKEAMVGIKDARRVALTLANRPVMVQQLTQFLDRVANVGAQHVLAIKLVIHLSDRTFQEGNAAGMAGAMP